VTLKNMADGSQVTVAQSEIFSILLPAVG
jgi:hypothetical protein